MRFDDFPIHDQIKNNLKERGFKRPTDIQYKCIRHILNKEDVMAIAPTGTGKTLTFIIPLLNQFLVKHAKSSSGISALVISPTRELAIQIFEEFKKFKIEEIKVEKLIGGVEQDQQIEQLFKGVDILVSTPGRLFDLIAQGHVNITRLKTLVIDEADLMLDLGFKQDVEDIVKKIPKQRQTLFFTATINKKIKSLAYDVVRNAIRIQITKGNPVSKNVQHSVFYVEMDDKRFFLENVLKEYEDGKFIVFVRTKVRAERVHAAMQRVGISTLTFHGGKDQNERTDTLNSFRSSEKGVLVTTDLACRGIDIPNMDYVINYDLPDNPENYVHRCGRTGRGEKKGLALSFCSTTEQKLLEDIEEYTGEKVDVYEVSKSEYLQILSDTEDLESDWKKLMQDEGNTEYWED